MKETYMREAIRISLEKMREGHGGPFGAIVVCDGHIIARGWNQVTSTNDPTAHAEIVAIREACRHLGDFKLDRCELYTSCEPCPMCLSAIYWARLGQIYYGSTREDAADAGFDDELIYQELSRAPAQRKVVMRQLLREDALEAFEEWKAKPDKVPY